MLTLKNTSTNPYFNLALEEYALKHLNLDEDIILLWQNEPSVIIGRNQNTIEEINEPYIKKHDIHVVRRLSGGGAVYHDLGNLNFTFITSSNAKNVNNYEKFTAPVIKALNALGVPAEFSGRNDIVVEDKKISGNAQYYFGNRMLHHGTILFQSDLTIIGDALNVKLDKIQSKGIKSVKSRVTNIVPHLAKPLSMADFKTHLLTYILKTEDLHAKEYVLTSEDMAHIHQLMATRYSTWAWNYGESPAFNLQKSKRYRGGQLDLRLNVKHGTITNIKIYGDFFGQKDLSDLENELANHLFEEQTVREILNKTAFDDYFFKITKDDFIDCLFY